MRLPPTPCHVCLRPCVFNKFSHFSGKQQNEIAEAESPGKVNGVYHSLVRRLWCRWFILNKLLSQKKVM